MIKTKIWHLSIAELKSMGSLVKLVAPLGDNQKPRKDSVTNVSTHHVTNLLHSLMVDDQGKDVTIISSEGEHVRYGHFGLLLAAIWPELNLRLEEG